MPQVVRKNSIGSRFSSSFGSIILGLIFIVGSIVGMFWNESRSVNMIRALDDVEKVVIEIGSDQVKSENDGKMVALSGNLTFSTAAVDSSYAIDSNSFALVRIVEVFQWEETQSGSSTDSEVTYTYTKVWTTINIDSSSFYSKDYQNPAWPSGEAFSSKQHFSADAKLGAFNLSTSQLASLPANVDVQIPSQAVMPASGFSISGGYITNASSTPQVGDIRISFKQSDVTQASVLAKQQGANLVDYTTANDVKINRIFVGILTSQEMIKNLQQENNTLTWILRLVFTILECVGIAMLFSPIQLLSSIIPLLGRFLGRLTKGIIFVIAVTIGLAISLLVISIAWIAVRPLVAIPLLIAVVVLIVFSIRTSKRKASQLQQQNS